MNRSVELTAIDLGKETAWLRDLQRTSQPAQFRDVDFAEDDLEQPITADNDDDEAPGTEAPAADTSNPPPGVYSPIMVFENDIREFYPRRGNRSGTRIVYRSGAARPVREGYEEVKAKFAGLLPGAD